MLYGAYRRDDASNPELFIEQAVVLLGEYPRRIVLALCDPRTGLQTRQKWPPNPFEIRQFCDAEMRHLEVLWRYSPECRRRERAAQIEPSRTNRPTLDELRDKYGPNWGIRTMG